MGDEISPVFFAKIDVLNEMIGEEMPEATELTNAIKEIEKVDLIEEVKTEPIEEPIEEILQEELESSKDSILTEDTAEEETVWVDSNTLEEINEPIEEVVEEAIEEEVKDELVLENNSEDIVEDNNSSNNSDVIRHIEDNKSIGRPGMAQIFVPTRL